MTWLTWRQFRAQAVTAAAALAAFAILLVVLGLRLRDSYDQDIAGCGSTNSCGTARDAFLEQYDTLLFLVSVVLLAVPALIGIFWGAPLITRELEAGTHRLVWSQSVTRTRWLAVKLAVPALAAVVFSGAFSLLLTWAASPYDTVEGDRFGALSFGSRNVTPLAYSVFAFVLATALGLLVRHTLAAMAVTLAVLVAVQLAVPFLVRPELREPVRTRQALTAKAAATARIHLGGQHVQVLDYVITGAWVLDSTHDLLDSDDKPVLTDEVKGCLTGNRAKDVACLSAKDLHFEVTYQPADRYWMFQWTEFAGYAAAAGLLAAFSLRWIRRPMV
ncbi:transporter [Streptomyces viridochromogenes]|uniref:Putative Transmembrane transport protein n=1 Tax=Streptomyces viridochromogenes Tue57 TaxID=1160705 RepID=L8NYC2_STRVR|nr:transporter [Streptomyces viridochromogenes]ELS50296.1 putative Transmembrane transport protein [Streptomyces viridochromogenes Tue57]